MNDTLNRLQHDWKVAKDALVFALLNIPSTTEEKEAAIKKVCDLELLPPTWQLEEIFVDKYGVKSDTYPYNYNNECVWRNYWYEERFRVTELTEILEYAEELCENGGGKAKVVSTRDGLNDKYLSYPEIVDDVFEFMVTKKVRGIVMGYGFY